MFQDPLTVVDPEVASLIKKETERQEFGLELIPSENFVPEGVLEASGSVLTNKYAEGLPGRRYYGGCEVIDQIEQLAIDRAKALFGVEFVNVQPHSGAAANQAIFEAFLSPGDTVMGMKLDHGGHLTHGSPVNFSGKHYKVVAYGVTNDTHLIDPDEVMDLAKEHKPKLIICGASAYSRRIDFELFRRAADQVGALVLADIAHYAGLVATGDYPNPSPYADFVTTTTHKTLRGPRSGIIMGKEKYSKEINKAVFPGLQGGPHEHTIAAKAVAFKIASTDQFKNYSRKIIENAKALAAGLAGRGFPIISGGTDSHLFLVDMRKAGITGKEAQSCLDSVNITANKNTIPYDPEPPLVCSGVRFGTPSLTTRGMGVKEMDKVAELIVSAIQSKGEIEKLQTIKQGVHELASGFPLYRYRLDAMRTL